MASKSRPIDRIKSLLDKGDYMNAASLADQNKITDCRNICQNLEEINDISNSIEDSISCVTALEDKINKYDSELRNISDTIKNVLYQVEGEERAVKVKSKNLTDTCDLIKELLYNLRLPSDVQKILEYESFDDGQSIGRMESALSQLGLALQYEPEATLQNMRCVKEQKTRANEIKLIFCGRFHQYFTQYLDGLMRNFSESFLNNIRSQAITMPGHDVIHSHLAYFTPIIQWIKANDSITYQNLNDFYVESSWRQYDSELRIFFDCVKEKMSNPIRHHGRMAELASDPRKRNSMTMGESSTRASSLSGGATTDTQDTVSGKSSEISYTGWDEFDAYIERILYAIHPTCLQEQRFYSVFFQATDELGAKVTDRRILEIFSSLERGFIDFANYYNNQNGLYSLYLFVRLSHYLRDQNNSNLFLNQIYPKVLIEVKRNFDNFMEQQLMTIREFKPPKTSKCGVISVVKNFEQFVTQVESLFKSTGARRTDIDRWYQELGSELFSTIDRLEHSKTPQEMIRIENYNYLNDVLSRYRSIKVKCLEGLRKKADLQYREARNAYVARYFGRPLEKLNQFFDGVEARLALGVKEEEISFQLAFSKQELRKVLQSVTLKEVRKGLEEMYRRIEKHAYEPDSNLIQAIWRDMQDEFLSQYKQKQNMIERCYPSSNLSLTFTIDDVIDVFKHIAQSH